MLNIEKAQNILNMVINEYPSLYSDMIELKMSDHFCLETYNIFNDSVIHIGKMDYQSKFVKWLNKYLKNEYGLDANKHMYRNFNDVFAFLHEVGHLYYFDILKENEKNEGYKEYKNEKFYNYNEAWESYRKIPNEKIADEFAVTFMNNNIIKIWAVMEDITIEKAKEEYDFWNEF